MRANLKQLMTFFRNGVFLGEIKAMIIAIFNMLPDGMLKSQSSMHSEVT